MAIVAMIATTKNPTKKTLSKVTFAHDDHGDHLSASRLRFSGQVVPFPLYNLFTFKAFFVLHSVAASSLTGLYDLVLISVASPPCKSSHVIPLFTCHAVKFFHVELRVSLFVHAHLILLDLEIHDRSAIQVIDCVFLCGIQVISCSFEFL